MPDLFEGELTPELFADAFSGQLTVGTLTKRAAGTRTVSQLTAGTQPTETAHTFDGFLEFREVRRPDQLGSEPLAVVSIIGNSVNPLVVPEPGDRIAIESFTFDVTEILRRDPVAALYECLVQ